MLLPSRPKGTRRGLIGTAATSCLPPFRPAPLPTQQEPCLPVRLDLDSKVVAKPVPPLRRPLQAQVDRVAHLSGEHVGRAGREGRDAPAAVEDLDEGEFGNPQASERVCRRGGRASARGCAVASQDGRLDLGKVDNVAGVFRGNLLVLDAGPLADFAVVGVVLDDGKGTVVARNVGPVHHIEELLGGGNRGDEGTVGTAPCAR